MYARSRSVVVVAVVVLVAACDIDDGALGGTTVPKPDLTATTLQEDPGKAAPSSTTATTTTTVTTTTTTIPTVVAFPRTYVGGGSSEWSLSWADGSCMVEGNTLELTLRANGTLSGSYGRTAPTFVGSTSVECGDQVFAYDPIEVTGQHAPPGSGTSDAGTVVVEIVGWPDWHIEGEYTPSEMVFEWTIDLEATGYEGDDPDPRIFRAIDYQLLLADEG